MPPYVIAVVPKLLACVLSNTSELAAVAVIEIGLVPPVAVIAPVCVTLPPEVNVKLRPMVDVAKIVASVFVKVTSFVLLFVNVIAPVKLLLLPFVVKSIALAPALKSAVPGTINVPLWVIAPAVVILKLPPAANVKAGKAIAPPLLNVKVKLRKLVSDK